MVVVRPAVLSKVGQADVLSKVEQADVLSKVGQADVLSKVGQADVLRKVGQADVLSKVGQADVYQSLGCRLDTAIHLICCQQGCRWLSCSEMIFHSIVPTLLFTLYCPHSIVYTLLSEAYILFMTRDSSKICLPGR